MKEWSIRYFISSHPTMTNSRTWKLTRIGTGSVGKVILLTSQSWSFLRTMNSIFYYSIPKKISAMEILTVRFPGMIIGPTKLRRACIFSGSVLNDLMYGEEQISSTKCRRRQPEFEWTTKKVFDQNSQIESRSSPIDCVSSVEWRFSISRLSSPFFLMCIWYCLILCFINDFYT